MASITWSKITKQKQTKTVLHKHLLSKQKNQISLMKRDILFQILSENFLIIELFKNSHIYPNSHFENKILPLPHIPTHHSLVLTYSKTQSSSSPVIFFNPPQSVFYHFQCTESVSVKAILVSSIYKPSSQVSIFIHRSWQGFPFPPWNPFLTGSPHTLVFFLTHRSLIFLFS